MEDRFKFRVWDKENKCLYHPARYTNFAIVNGTVIKIESYSTANSAYLGKRIVWEFDDAVIMQCTGLKDKNGVLIYEGDIVFYKIGSIICRDVVKWSPERCGWVKGYQDLSTYKKYCEVIGNKYENPELINNAT